MDSVQNMQFNHGLDEQDQPAKVTLESDPLPEELKENGKSGVIPESSLLCEVKDDDDDTSNRGSSAVESDPGDENAFSVTRANPLHNEYILEHMLQYIVSQPGPKGMSKDIQHIRLVSSLWKDVATRLHLKSPRTRTLVFDGVSNNEGAPRISQLPNFLNLMKDATMLPVQKFYIVGSKFYSDSSRGKLMEEFLQLCGPTAVYLKFFSSSSNTSVGVKLGSVWCPQERIDLAMLKTLELTYLHESKYPWTPSSPWTPTTLGFANFVGLLLSSASNLSEFQFKVIAWGGKEKQQEFALAQYFGEIICSRIPKTVRILKLLGMSIPDSILVGLTQLGLKLEEFSAQAITLDEVARKFLESQFETLKVLNISGLGGYLIARLVPADAENQTNKGRL